MKPRRIVNPLALLAGRQKLTPEIVIEQALPAWLYLDAILRGEGPRGAIHGLTRTIVVLQIVAADRQNRKLYDSTAKTVKLWLAALELAQQRDAPPDPSTSLCKMLRFCVETWDAILPQLELGLLVGALERWAELAHAFGMNEVEA